MAHRGLSTSFCAARAARRRRRRRLEESEYMRGRYIPWKRGLVLVRLVALYVFHQAACSEFKEHVAETAICSQVFSL